MKVGDMALDKSDGAKLLILEVDPCGDIYCYCLEADAYYWYFEDQARKHLEVLYEVDS